MPIISQFYGVTVRMFYKDHSPPHYHAEYAEFELIVGISPITILEGQAPGRVHSMVLEWTAIHQAELLDDWNRCRRREAPEPIDPLE